MAKQPKPTKQQIAQAKARAGGNNPIKVTDAGLKKLGKAAVTAATLLPAGRAVKVAATVAKAAKGAKAAKAVEKNKKVVNKIADIQQKTKTEKIAKNSVKVKPASKAATRLEKNSAEKARVDTAKTGAWARYEAGQIEKKRQLPSKVVKINSKNK